MSKHFTILLIINLKRSNVPTFNFTTLTKNRSIITSHFTEWIHKIMCHFSHNSHIATRYISASRFHLTESISLLSFLISEEEIHLKYNILFHFNLSILSTLWESQNVVFPRISSQNSFPKMTSRTIDPRKSCINHISQYCDFSCMCDIIHYNWYHFHYLKFIKRQYSGILLHRMKVRCFTNLSKLSARFLVK